MKNRHDVSTAIRRALAADPRPQIEIAKAAGLHPVNLSQFKAGKRELPFDSLVALAKVVGLEISAKPKKVNHGK
jgi:transcriptional regulator with XRE-family HTH domain